MSRELDFLFVYFHARAGVKRVMHRYRTACCWLLLLLLVIVSHGSFFSRLGIKFLFLFFPFFRFFLFSYPRKPQGCTRTFIVRGRNKGQRNGELFSRCARRGREARVEGWGGVGGKVPCFCVFKLGKRVCVTVCFGARIPAFFHMNTARREGF